MSRLSRSFQYAWQGFRSCMVSEPNFRIHIITSLLVVGAGFLLGISTAEWLVVLLCIGFVMAMEMLNTAIEKLSDVVHRDHHPGIRQTKDIAAGAVLASAIIAAICGTVIFLPKVYSLICTKCIA